MATHNRGFATLVKTRPTIGHSHPGTARTNPLEMARHALRLPEIATDDEIRSALANRGRAALNEVHGTTLAAAKKPKLTPRQIEIAQEMGVKDLDKYAADLSAQAEREAARKAARAANDAAIKKAHGAKVAK